MAKTLVIVESPAKARTLSRFLGDAYRVEASYGHVRDLPDSADQVPEEIRKKKWGRLGVDTDGDFKPYYVVPADKKKHVQALKLALKDASSVVLATDPDREGESISWHLLEVLKPKVPVRRIHFHEITETAIRAALATVDSVDENRVRAQETRRILDRLFGYTLSPVLWKKVQTGLSAGRVQSVAVRLIVEREEERRAFRGGAYWNLEARVRGAEREFLATLVRIGAERLAIGKDFDATTGQLAPGARARLLTETDGPPLVDALVAHLPWTVTSVEEKPLTQRPAPPFTTSTLQQEANRKLGFSADRTMQIAQRLFQGVELRDGRMEGLISYHRTDSTTLSEKALAEAGGAINQVFGAEYYRGPRQYQTRVRNAQEAHEAIRPTEFVLTPEHVRGQIDADELRLYELIWKRTIASQMADARLLRTAIEITAAGPSGEPCVFTASGKAIEFAGFLRAYVEGSDDPSSELGDQESILPKCAVGDRIGAASSDATGLTLVRLEPKRHETTPPARYTEASLVKRLEEDSIGRPSTYAPTIATIQKRGYVFRQGKALVPSFTAFAVTTLLRDHFGDYVNVGFTAKMEEDLDEISNGERDWLDFLRAFYRDGDGERRGLEGAVSDEEGQIAYPLIDVGIDADNGQPIHVRVGRYGPFLQLGEGGPGNTASLPLTLPPADLTLQKAMAILRAKAQGPRILGVDADTGNNVYLINGRFGVYVQLGKTPEKGDKEKPRRSSLTSDLSESTVTLEAALKLLALPRELGLHPESGQPILAGLGRYGPYIKHGDDFRSLESEDDLFTVDLPASLALLAAPKKQGRRRGTARRVIRQLEVTDGAAPLQVLEGRYGPYVTDGTINASVPRGADPAGLTLEEARGLIEARRDTPPREGRRPAARSKGATRARSANPGMKTARPKTAADTGEPAVKPAAKPAARRKATARKRASS
jgi:DNA topoisomerase-1